MDLSSHNTIGIGDGENDHAFLARCEYAVAVGDGVSALRERADYVSRAPGPGGVVEFIEEHVLNDLALLLGSLPRHQLRLGETHDGTPVTIPAHGANVLVVGPSGSGKSTLAGVLAERLVETGRCLCLLDPEGDYQTLGELVGVVVLGGKGHQTLPTAQEVERLFRHRRTSRVLNLSAMSRAEKVNYGAQVLATAAVVRGGRGLPHWIMIDEAHHLMPAEGSPAADVLSTVREGICLITLAADMLPPCVAGSMNTLASTELEAFAGGRRALAWGDGLANVGQMSDLALAAGEMLLGRVDGPAAYASRFLVDRRRSAHRRHIRKYAEGALPPERCFYFRGREGELNLRAENLVRFCELAKGVDDATWEHHLRRSEYSA